MSPQLRFGKLLLVSLTYPRSVKSHSSDSCHQQSSCGYRVTMSITRSGSGALAALLRLPSSPTL